VGVGDQLDLAADLLLEDGPLAGHRIGSVRATLDQLPGYEARTEPRNEAAHIPLQAYIHKAPPKRARRI
jgi:hypothetical protein